LKALNIYLLFLDVPLGPDSSAAKRLRTGKITKITLFYISCQSSTKLEPPRNHLGGNESLFFDENFKRAKLELCEAQTPQVRAQAAYYVAETQGAVARARLAEVKAKYYQRLLDS